MSFDTLLIQQKIKSAFAKGDGLLFRVLAFCLSSLFFSAYPMYLFAIYMAHNGFYAYEMQSDFFALRVFFFTAFILVSLVGVFLLFSVPVVILTRKYLKNAEAHSSGRHLAIAYRLLIAFNAAIVGLFIWTQFKDFDPSNIAFAVACLAVGAIFNTIMFARGRAYLITLVTTIVFSLILPILNNEGAASLCQISLRQFNLAGVYVDVISKEKKIEGKLIFLSPSFVYLALEEKNRLSVIPRNADVTINFLHIYDYNR